MSYVLEGIILPVAESVATDEAAKCGILFDVLRLDDEISILARPGRPAFDDAVSVFARRLSCHMRVVLLVRWDDRVGVRESRIFHDGSQTHQFTNDDELYVMLNDDGMPLRDGRRYQESEFDDLPDEEFEVFQNALELGCEQSAFCSWQLLHTFIRRQG
jgi:hypothetical protein